MTWKKASRMCKAKTGVGCDGFHLQVPLDFDKRNERRNCGEFLEKVEQSGNWPQQACTTMFFLIPKNVTSERPVALMPTLNRWWESLRAPEVAKWQQKYRVETVWGAQFLMEMERFNGIATEEDQGAKACAASLWSGLGRRISVSQERSCECFAVVSSTRGGYSAKDVRQSRYGPSRPSCQGPSGVACFRALCCGMRLVKLSKFTLRRS